MKCQYCNKDLFLSKLYFKLDRVYCSKSCRDKSTFKKTPIIKTEELLLFTAYF